MHIVHLEDTKPLRDILLATITALRPGCNINQFITSDEALDYIQQYGSDVDLFLLDVRVPGSIDGMDLAEKIYQMGYPGLIVMTSAYMSPGRSRLEEIEARWYQKPWQIQHIQEMLRLAAERRPV